MFPHFITKLKSFFLSLKLSLFFLPLPFLPAFGATVAPMIEKSPLILGQGEQRVLHVPGLLRYSLGSDSVRSQSLSLFFKSTPQPALKNQILLKGVRPGQSDLWVWKSDGSTEHRSIRVQKVTSEDIKPALQKALSRLEETEIIISGAGIILRGEIQSLAESSRIQAIIEGFPKEIRNQTELAPALLNEGESRLKKWIQESVHHSQTHHPQNQIRIERHHGTLFLIGSVDRAMELPFFQKEARALFPATQIEITALPDDSPTIYFRVFLLELKKSRFHSLGLSWPSAQQAAFKISAGGIENLLQLDLTLQELEGEGSVKILSNPELAVRAPGEAELFSGGELPIYIQRQQHSNITWKNFGLTLKLKVSHVSGQKIRLDILTEVSSLDPSIADHQVPGIQSNRMKTQVDANYGKPLLLSGLLQQGARQQARGLPILRQIPILGALFGSEDYLNERSELVAILLPLVNPPAAPMKRVEILPRGPMPIAREWFDPQVELQLKNSPEYPWNVLSQEHL